MHYFFTITYFEYRFETRHLQETQRYFKRAGTGGWRPQVSCLTSSRRVAAVQLMEISCPQESDQLVKLLALPCGGSLLRTDYYWEQVSTPFPRRMREA